MKNREQYREKILAGKFDCEDIQKLILHNTCNSISCCACHIKTAMWLDEEAKEEAVDWSKVAVDTLIHVSLDGKKWSNRYFARYDNDKVYAFTNGATSKTADANASPETPWKYAKLCEQES